MLIKRPIRVQTQISILQLLPKRLSEPGQGKASLPPPAGLHLPPRTRGFKKPPLEFNPNKFVTDSTTERRGAAQKRTESKTLLVNGFSL